MFERIFTEIALSISDADVERRTLPRVDQPGDVMKLIELQVENFKRIVAVTIRPNADGVTRIIGDNEAGKTSALDAIAAALGGAAYSPDLPIRRGATSAQVVCDLGNLVVRRKWTGKGSTLEVTGADGVRVPGGAQGVLDKLWSRTAIDPTQFERQDAKKQAVILATIAGVNLEEYQARYQAAYDRRMHANRLAAEAKGKLAGMQRKTAPAEPVSVAALMDQLQAVQVHNRLIDRLSDATNQQAQQVKTVETNITIAKRKLEELIRQVKEQEQAIQVHEERLAIELTKAKELERQYAETKPQDESEIRDRIAKASELNEALNHNRRLEELELASKACHQTAEARAKELADLVAAHEKAIAGTTFPVKGLTFTADGVMIDGIPFDQCSAAQRLRTSVAIGLALNPTLKLLLVRDGSLIGEAGMKILNEMATAAGAQVLVERVENGTDVGVRIVDGHSVEPVATDTGAA